MKSEITSIGRRQFLMAAGVAGVAAAVPLAATRLEAADGYSRVIVSGRVTGADAKALAGAAVTALSGPDGPRIAVTTDGDGRFLFETSMQGPERPEAMLCRVTPRGGRTEMCALRFVRDGNVQRDEAGAWRATFGLTVT